MAKPEIIVNAGTAGAMTSVSASSAWTATLDSVDGVRQVAWSVISTDETTTAESYTLVQSGSVGQNVASTSQGQGTAILLKAIVNAGINAATGQADPTNTSATVKIVVPLSDGGIVGCAGEEYESDATFGAAGIINSGIRKAAALSPSGVAVKIVRAATAAALPTNTRTGNVLTATSNAAIGTVGGVVLAAGDYFLVQNEGGGASHVNNGAFYLSQQGDGSNPWKATRATYFDDSAELIAMTTFRIQEGTYAGKERYLVTSGATINVTALEFGSYAYAPVDPAYLMVGASGDLANERDISAIGTTLDFASTTTIPLQASRTDAATAALVDVETVSALSSGSAAAGFGPAIKFLGEVSGGGAENYGRVGFAATDLTGGSEDTKAVLQARTAGAALATVAEFSGTAVSLPGIATGVAGILAIDTVGGITRTAGGGASTSAKYVTDAAATVNANDVPLQAMTGTLEFLSTARPVGFAHETAAAGTTEIARHRRTITAAAAGLTGTGGYDSWWIPDGAGTEVEAFRLNARWNQVVGPYAEVALSLNSNGSLTERIVFGPSGAITTPGIITGASFIGVSLDRATAGALTLGGTNATSIAASGLKITGLGTPTADTDAATKGYADALAQGLDIKASALAATTANITLSGTQTIDTVAVTAGKRVLVKDQSSGPENGLYLCAAGAWTRTTDLAAGASAAGAFCFIEEGSQADTGWVCTSNVGADVVDTDSLAFTQFSATTVTAGAGLTKTGNTIDVVANADGTITVNANDIQVATGGLTNTQINASAAIDGTKIAPAFGAQSISQTGATSITAGSAGFIGVALDTSGAATLTLGGTNATALTVSRTGITTTVAGGLTVNGSAAGDVLILQKDGIGTTKTIGGWLYNATNSGTQVSPMLAWSAYNGGTRVNLGIQWEPQSTTRGKLVFYSGTSTTAPASSGLTYFDTQDSNFGEGWVSPGFYVISGLAVGFRFMNASNRGGMDLDGSNLLRLKSYSNTGFLLSIYSDAGSTLSANTISVDGAGKGRSVFVPHAVTSSGGNVTFPLATSQNIRHTTTEATTLAFTGATPGMRGTLDFIQGGTGRVVTFPTNGSGVEYSADLVALGVTAIVDATANTRTVLTYYVTDSPNTRVYITSRSVTNPIP